MPAEDKIDYIGTNEEWSGLITFMAFTLFQCHIHTGKSDVASFALDSLIISIHQHTNEKTG